MKLRNKKTGQEGNFIINKDHFECADLEYVPEYHSLAELNKEWEDYDEESEKEAIEMIEQIVKALDKINANMSRLCGREKQ